MKKKIGPKILVALFVFFAVFIPLVTIGLVPLIGYSLLQGKILKFFLLFGSDVLLVAFAAFLDSFHRHQFGKNLFGLPETLTSGRLREFFENLLFV